MKKIGLLIALVLIFCGISYAHSDQFDLVSDYSYESPLWYFGSPGNTSIGYYGYSNGSSTISFKNVIAWSPDQTIRNFEATESISSDSASVYVTTSNAYYMRVSKRSGFPRGTVFADYR